MDQPIGPMMMPGVGFVGLLFVGILAGYLAERAMNRHHGILTNLLVGIAGSFVGGTLARTFPSLVEHQAVKDNETKQRLRAKCRF
jgi:uncharacterized membrane protein YeaQ/YmgE (transglycosylase-associated protein family)